MYTTWLRCAGGRQHVYVDYWRPQASYDKSAKTPGFKFCAYAIATVSVSTGVFVHCHAVAWLLKKKKKKKRKNVPTAVFAELDFPAKIWAYYCRMTGTKFKIERGRQKGSEHFNNHPWCQGRPFLADNLNFVRITITTPFGYPQNNQSPSLG